MMKNDFLSYLEISDYLKYKNRQNREGVCKKCNKNVFWSRSHLARHKRGTCIDTERKIWKSLKEQTTKPVEKTEEVNDSEHDSHFDSDDESLENDTEKIKIQISDYLTRHVDSGR